MVESKPLPFPPEPFRWIFLRLCQRAIKSADEHEGSPNPWRKTVGLFGDGVDPWNARTPAARAGAVYF